MAASTVLTIEETIKTYLLSDLPGDPHFLLLERAVGDIPVHCGKPRPELVSPEIILIECPELEDSGNPQTMPSTITRGSVEIIGIVRATDKDRQAERARYLGTAIWTVLRSYKFLTDVVTGYEIYGFPRRLRIEEVDVSEVIADVGDLLFRGCEVTYEFDIPHNV